MLMRGGTSKGAYFLARDLPADPAERDGLLLRIMGSPDPRQIDGIGGAHPLTSKVAVIPPRPAPTPTSTTCSCRSGSTRLPFPTSRTAGTCSPGWARSRSSGAPRRRSRRSASTWSTPSSVATATFPAAGGAVDMRARPRSPGFRVRQRPSCSTSPGPRGRRPGRLLPTGHVTDDIGGVRVTCVDNGMPVVVVAAGDVGCTGYETVGRARSRSRPERQGAGAAAGGRAAHGAGRRVAPPVPKVSLVAAPRRRRHDLHPHLHPGPGARVDRGARRGQRRDRAAARRGGRPRPGRITPGQARFDIEHPAGTSRSRPKWTPPARRPR